MRQHLTDVENEFKWNERYEDDAAQMALHYREDLSRHYKIVSSPHGDADDQLVIEYDESVFWSDPTLVNIIARLVEYQELVDGNMRENLSRLEGLLQHIAVIRKTQFGDVDEGEHSQASRCIPFVR